MELFYSFSVGDRDRPRHHKLDSLQSVGIYPEGTTVSLQDLTDLVKVLHHTNHVLTDGDLHN